MAGSKPTADRFSPISRANGRARVVDAGNRGGSVGRRRQAQRYQREETGTFQDSTLTLAIDLLRIQWIVGPRLDAESLNLENQPPVLGSFMERQAWFCGLMERWLPNCPPLVRLAFNASLWHAVSDHQSGYRMLNRYLRCVEVDPGSSDFLYRINRARPSATTIQGLIVNRLSTWTVAKFAVALHAVSGGDVPQIERQPFQDSQRFFCAVELDINTNPNFQGPLPPQELASLFAELVSAGVQIATHGDPTP